ncbi:MAG: hypothetical protein IIY05_03600 [Alistipes sp.]|nr:hypothetical protein [Alistipes sp.]
MRYLFRAVKYFLAFCVLYLGVVWLSVATTKGMDVSVWDYVVATLATQRGQLLVAAVVVLSAAYPWFGFVVRRMKWNMATDADELIAMFAAAGFSLKSQAEGRMVFKATNILDRIVMLFEDEIEVEQQGEEIVVSGIRRGVAKIVYRLG